jgi:FkbM family methyltransferase
MHRSFHPIFDQFERWSGEVPAGFSAGYLGQMTADKFRAYKPRAGLASFPPAHEELFQWIMLLEAVMTARRVFTMMELGAGHARWLVNAACAARQRRPDLALKLVGVEAEPTHFQWMLEHFRNNGLDPAAHLLINAAVNGDGARCSFTVGHPDEWYGQAIIEPGSPFGDWPQARVVETDTVSVPWILSKLGPVDLIDADIQGAELDCFDYAMPEMGNQVRRVHLATHSDKIHAHVGNLFAAAGWSCAYAVPPGMRVDTHAGPIQMQDGVQSWINTALAHEAKG